jgi:hypothetical protein
MDEDRLWLNVPQAVVLSVTGDLDVTLRLAAPTPSLLVIKANELVARRTVLPVAADPDPAQRAEALIRLRETKMAEEQGRYAELERQVHRCVIAGARTMACRTPGAPYENINPVEYTKAELQGVDAVDKRTGKVILFDLRINCRDLIERLAEMLLAPADAAAACSSGQDCQPVSEEIEKWRCGGDPVPELIDWARSKWGDDGQALPNRNELLRVFREQFGRVLGVNEKVMREVRRELAPPEARRGGSPSHQRYRSTGK